MAFRAQVTQVAVRQSSRNLNPKKTSAGPVPPDAVPGLLYGEGMNIYSREAQAAEQNPGV